ncbi:dnaJ-like protein 60 isoform X2 [Phlebotomus argentipes]|uniref:dnaJ-like protein 60 isoform X2 n=1 Tax=Phlebotomus argentipes TaxID=94469 RepID=UPI0028934E2B|nr:dnaJ-like protein 60 isoform X2 [Phlebotomus argentipes]
MLGKAHTYYDVLRVKPTCSQKEIRESFLQLSKEFHPDTNLTVTQESTKKFQKILEAYQVLGKTDSRKIYDADLRLVQSNSSSSSSKSYPRFYRDFHPPGSPGGVKQGENYYGLKGVKRVSNYIIVLLCAIFTGIGVTLQVLAIRSSMTFKRENLDLQSEECARQHAQAKADANKYGNDLQIKRLMEKMRGNR